MVESSEFCIEMTAGGGGVAEVSAPGEHLPAIVVSSPHEFGGPGDLWTPEHLFVASLATCLMTTFFAVARNSRLNVVSYSDEALGHVQRGDDRLYTIDKVVLRPHVVVQDEPDTHKVMRLLDKAETACLISRSVRSTVEMHPQVSLVEPV